MSNQTKARAWVAEGAKLVDVRSPGEFATGALPGAVNIPVDEIAGRTAELGDPNGKIVLYCASGGRSGAALALLSQRGFTQLLNAGGIHDY